MFLEINPHLADKKQDMAYAYPEKIIVEWAIENGLRFSYGSDTHKPSSVGVNLDELELDSVYGKALDVWENGK